MLLILCLLASFAIQSWLLAKLASKSNQAPKTDVCQTMLASFARPLENVASPRLQSHGILRQCVNLKATNYESTSLNRIAADKSDRVIVA